MARIRVSEDALRRATAPVGPPPKSGGTLVIGLIGWVVAVAAGAALTFIVMNGVKARAEVRNRQAEQFTRLRQELQPQVKVTQSEGEALQQRADDLRREIAESQDYRQKQRRLQLVEARLEQARAQRDEMHRQYLATKERIGCPHETLAALIDDYRKAQVEPIERPADNDALMEDRPAVTVDPNRAPDDGQDGEDTGPKLESRMIDIYSDSARFKSRNAASVKVELKNGDFNNEYEVRAVVIIYGQSARDHKRNRVYKRVDRQLTLGKRATVTVFDGEVTYQPRYTDYEFEGYAILVYDKDGNLVTGKTAKTSTRKFLEKFGSLQSDTTFDSQINPL